MQNLQSKIDRIAENIAARIKIKVQQQLSDLSFFEEDSTPRQTRGRKPGPKTAGRATEDLDNVDQQILGILTAEPLTVKALSKKLKVATSAVYKRIGRLKSERRLKLVKEGKQVLYTAAPRRGPKAKVKAKRPRAAGKA